MSLLPGLPIEYHPSIVPVEKADYWFRTLRDELAWVRRDTTPRLEYYANRHTQAKAYTYGSGEFARTYEVQPWHEIITAIQGRLNDFWRQPWGFSGEACFLNRYLNQSMHLGWHSDNSPEMDDARPIAIVSLGEPRDILFRPIMPVLVPTDTPLDYSVAPERGEVKFVRQDQPNTRLLLGHGSVCIMLPGMQDTHQHRIPKCSRQCGERISLTFRGYIP